MSVYRPSDVEPPVASPNIFTVIPPFGISQRAGTSPPATWDHGEFLGPIGD